MTLSVSEQNILQRKLASFITSEVFNTIDETDLLKVEGSKWFHKGKELTPDEIKLLQVSAKSLLKSPLWKILSAELLWHAQNKTLSKGETEADLISGKLLRFIVEVIEKRLGSMAGKV